MTAAGVGFLAHQAWWPVAGVIGGAASSTWCPWGAPEGSVKVDQSIIPNRSSGIE